MAMLQAATILVPMVSGKYIWWLKFQQKLPIGNQQIKKKKKKGKNVNNLSLPGKLSMNYSLVNAYGTFISYIVAIR